MDVHSDLLLNLGLICQLTFWHIPTKSNIHQLLTARISLPIGTNGKPLAAIDKFPSAIGKLTIGKTLATNAEEITNAMIGNDELANYW